MLTPDSLATLKLRDLLDDSREVATEKNWRWQGRTWIYEGIGFTWFGSLLRNPSNTIALELAFSELTKSEEANILGALRLPLKRSMTQEDLVSVLGPQASERRYVPDRVTLQFLVGPEAHYSLDATIHEASGLVHFSVIPRRLLP